MKLKYFACWLMVYWGKVVTGLNAESIFQSELTGCHQQGGSQDRWSIESRFASRIARLFLLKCLAVLSECVVFQRSLYNYAGCCMTKREFL